MNIKLISEIIGPTYVPNIGRVVRSTAPSQRTITNDPWQNDIITKIANGDSLLINILPAAGKTKPVMNGCFEQIKPYFQNKLGNPNRPPNQPFSIANTSLLWVVPINQLAVQAYNEMKDFLLEKAREIIESDPTSYGANVTDFESLIKLINDMIGFKTGGSTIHDSISPSENTLVDICTYEPAEEIASKYYGKYRCVVIDEAQEIAPLRPQTVEEEADKAKTYAAIFSHCIHSQFILLTGSLSTNSCNELIEILRQAFHKNLTLIQDSAAKNRSHIIVEKTSNLSTNNDIIDICKSIIRFRSTNNLIILFSRRNIQFISDRLKEQLSDINNIEYGHSIDYSNYNYNYRQPDSLKDAINRYRGRDATREHKMSPSSDYLLSCLRKGFGFLVGAAKSGNEDLDVTNDRDFVAQLFSSGRIYVLLATDAVGVGVSLKVKNLYIPSLKKFNGQYIDKVDESSLIQLLHRAGRGAFPIAKIICNPDDYDYINNILNSDPSQIPDSDLSTFKQQAINHNWIELLKSKFMRGR
jgi:hypothetical protein